MTMVEEGSRDLETSLKIDDADGAGRYWKWTGHATHSREIQLQQLTKSRHNIPKLRMNYYSKPSHGLTWDSATRKWKAPSNYNMASSDHERVLEKSFSSIVEVAASTR